MKFQYLLYPALSLILVLAVAGGVRADDVPTIEGIADRMQHFVD
jgi:hypothetical protein